MNELFRILGIVQIDSTKAKTDLDGIDTKAKTVTGKMGTAFGAAGKAIGTAVVAGTAVAGAAVVALGVTATKAAADFQAGFQNLDTLLGGNKDRINELKEDVKALAPATGQSLSTLTDGLYQVVSAFGDSADTASSLDINARAAAAGLATVEQAVALTSAVTKGYGDTTAEAQQKAADLAFTAVKLGQTTFPELAASIGKVVPLSTSLGISQEELFAVMATGTGVTGTASEVSTQLRGVMQSLMAPTASMTALIAAQGYESGAALIESEGLAGALALVTGEAEASGLPLQNYISSIDGQTLALTLAGSQSDVYQEKLAAMNLSNGAAAEAFAIQQQSVTALWGQIQQLGNVVVVSLGEKFLPLLQQLLSWVVLNMPAIQATMDTVFNAVDLVINTVKTTLANFRTSSEGDFAAISSKATEFFTALKTLWETVLKPAWDAMAPYVTQIIQGIGTLFGSLLTTITETITLITALFNGDWSLAWESASTIVTTILGALATALVTVGGNLIAGLISGLTAGFTNLNEKVTEIGDGVINKFKSIFGIQSPSTVLRGIGVFLTEGLGLGIIDSQAFTTLQTRVQTVAEAVISGFQVILFGDDGEAPQSIGEAFVQGIIDGVNSKFPDLQATLDAMKLNTFLNNADPAISTPPTPGMTLPSDGINSGDGTISSTVAPLITALQEVATVLTPLPDAVVTVTSAFNILPEPILDYTNTQREASDAARAQMEINAQLEADAAAIKADTAQAQADAAAQYINSALASSDAAMLNGTAQQFSAEATITAAQNEMEVRAQMQAAQMANYDVNTVMLSEFIRRVGEGLGAAGAFVVDFAGQFGSAVMDLAVEKIPFFGTILGNLTNPIGMVSSIFTQLLGSSESFKKIIEIGTSVFGHLVEMLDRIFGATIQKVGDILIKLFQAVEPLIELFFQLINVGLQPVIWVLENVFAPVMKAVSGFIAGIWNAFATAINWALGWLGVNLPKIDPNGGSYQPPSQGTTPAPVSPPGWTSDAPGMIPNPNGLPSAPDPSPITVTLPPNLGGDNFVPPGSPGSPVTTTPSPVIPTVPRVNPNIPRVNPNIPEITFTPVETNIPTVSLGEINRAAAERIQNQSTSGRQISNITGATADLLVSSLQPLQSLSTLAGIANRTYDLLDRRLNPLGGGSVSISGNTFEIHAGGSSGEIAEGLVDSLEEALAERLAVRNRYE